MTTMPAPPGMLTSPDPPVPAWPARSSATHPDTRLQEGQYESTVATITDRVVQASLKLALEPIFEADFLPCSYGFRPNRRAHDAVAEVHHFTSRSYEWIVEGDIKACLDAWSHCSFADCHDQNSWSWGLGSSIRRPFMRPVRVRMARSSPRFTRCNMVWRETPRARVA